jgi:hypothetical protein
MEMWKTLRVSHISTPPTTTTDKGQKRRYTNIPLGTKDRSGHREKKCDVFLIGRIVGNPKDIYRPRAYEIGVGIGGWVFIPWPGPNGGEDKDHPLPCGCK